MHLCGIERDFWGANAIVAAQIPIAGGMALSNQLRKNNKVAVVFFGDGASCEGVFFETLNMAALWKIPLLFVCENNGFAISVPTRNAIPIQNIADRALGFGLPGVCLDGNDPQEVFLAVRDAALRARSGVGPTLIECKTVRWERHSAISAGKYDNDDEANKWKRADPIPRLEKIMRERGVSESDLALCRERAQRANDEALQFALASQPPAASTVSDFVFA
jgi:pyruvate dehydrogenase E1 component alpha subunit